jgi:hypothetical protein
VFFSILGSVENEKRPFIVSKFSNKTSENGKNVTFGLEAISKSNMLALFFRVDIESMQRKRDNFKSIDEIVTPLNYVVLDHNRN